MNSSNTVSKGDELEVQVYELIRDLVKSNQFFVNGAYSEVYRQKDYYSKDREEHIRVDVAIECFMPGAKEYSSLIIIECKNYGSKVPVGKVEEFCHKLHQIGAHNTKGIMIATSEFQKGGKAVAKNKGLGLARLKAGNELEWICRRKASTLPQWTPGVITKALEESQTEYTFFGCLEGVGYTDLPSLLMAVGAFDFYQPSASLLPIPFLPEEAIEKRVIEWPDHLYFRSGQVDMERLCELMSEVYGVDFDFYTHLGQMGSQAVLGKLQLDTLKIFIDPELQADPHRWRFTLAHEIGHLALHLNLLERFYDQKLDTASSLTYASGSHPHQQRLEWQANRFASFLLLPKDKVLPVVLQYFQEHDIYKGHLLLDEQRMNQQLVFGLIHILREQFGVSKEVIKLRLKQLQLLRDTTDYSIGTALRGLKKPFQNLTFPR